MITNPRATIEDLYNVPENSKAELVNGELVITGPSGAMPGRGSGKVYSSLEHYEEERGGGYAIPDNVGFIVKLPNRESFSPDAAWYVGDLDGLKFATGTPRFAVEVRSENDYGPAAERAIRQKILDYFAAGTLVVWDMDLQSDDVVRKHSAADPDNPTVFRRGDIADAEPAVPGWRFPVDRLFR